jgi:hypothetical protein
MMPLFLDFLKRYIQQDMDHEVYFDRQGSKDLQVIRQTENIDR